ncbi:MAG: hypothetical protein IAE90_02650 [Ignavibacteria bacterium]|nr:hypothetical protein [Ignavibacteria bacterium]
MKNKPLVRHDIISLLRTFSAKDIKRFSLYLSSEFFTTRRSLLILYNRLIEFHPLYTHVNCTKELLYSEVYPELKYNGGTMRDLLSDLHEAAVDFITMEALRKDKCAHLTRVKELRERGLAKQAFKYLEEQTQEENNLNNIDSNYFLNRYNLFIQKINLNAIFRHKTRQKAVNSMFDDINDSGLSILLFSILEITANYSNFILMESTFREEADDGFMNNTIKDLHNSGIFRRVMRQENFGFMAEVYLSMLDALLKKGSFEKYTEYKALVKKYSSKFSRDELSMHYSKLISSCIRGAQSGKHSDKFNIELISLYYELLEKGYYRNNKTKYIPSNLFRAIVLHSVKMNKLDWLKKVIGRFLNEVQPADIDNMRNFAMAYYFYASGRSGKAIEAICKLNITQFIFKYDIYNLKLRIFYENGEYSAAIELIHTYRQFLRCDKLMPSSRKVFHRNFMKYAARLLAIADGSKKYEAGLEMQKLDKEDCAYKEWLTDKFTLFAGARKKYSIAG